MNRLISLIIFFPLFIIACTSNTKKSLLQTTSIQKQNKITHPHLKDEPIAFEGKENTIHILVALCDNKYQGIVPVAKKMGNGQKTNSNLYWGAAYGIKTFFKRSKDWKLIKSYSKDGIILERVVFKHQNKNFYIIADAYDGKFMKRTVTDYLESLSGKRKDTIHVKELTLGIHGNAKLLAFIGHNGLMDFNLESTYKNTDNKQRDTIVLACVSKDYFSPYIKAANGKPIVWTTGLMAPEAYTIHDALIGYVRQESDEQIRLRAALAYSKYQKCSLNAANNLLVSGF